MLIVFDIDGTLIGGETFDWASFDASFESSAGFALTPSQHQRSRRWFAPAPIT